MIIRTEHSTYELSGDQLSRVPVADEASQLRKDDETVTVIDVAQLEVGQPAILYLVGVSDTPHTVTIRTTTPVVEIEGHR